MDRYTEKKTISKKKILKPSLSVDKAAILYTYHFIFFMIIAEYREASSMSKCSHLPKSLIINGFRHYDNWWVRGADRKFLINIA